MKKIFANKYTPAKKPIMGQYFTSWLREANIKILDIGARGNSLPELDQIASLSHIYACEPDIEEAGELKLILEKKWNQATVFSEALYPDIDNALLYVTQRKGLSSLLKPNNEIISRYYSEENNLYSIVNQVNVKTISLDAAAKKYDFLDVGFVKIDTQGTELQILKSGESLLMDQTVGIHIEVEFQEFYKGQHLFSDVDSYLRSLGFSLFDVEKRFLRRARYNPKYYSRRQTVWGNALYLKEPTLIMERSGGDKYTKLKQLLAIAMAFEFYDLSLEIFQYFKKFGDNQLELELNDYISLMSSFYLSSEKASTLNHGAKEKRRP